LMPVNSSTLRQYCSKGLVKGSPQALKETKKPKNGKIQGKS
jgi:hypothetical protein